MLRAFIVDDEPLARDELAYLLKRSKQVDIVGQNGYQSCWIWLNANGMCRWRHGIGCRNCSSAW